MTRARSTRRSFLRGLAGTAAAGAVVPWFARRAGAQTAGANRVLFFYFPDGVPGESQNGEPSLWHPTGGGTSFDLPAVLTPLAAHKNDCVFFTGLSMGGTDAGSHPGGAKKLLTGKDGGQGWSIDHYLAQTAGADAPFRHVYLGAQANHNNASGDKHIVYVAPGQTRAPEDNPLAAFEWLFGSPAPGTPVSGSTSTPAVVSASRVRDVSVIDGMLADLSAYRTRLGAADAAKLEFHVESLRQVETRVRALAAPSDTPPPPAAPTCDDGAGIQNAGVDPAQLYDPAHLPAILRMQMDVMVNAMACGLTRVGTIQASHHTSELIMSRFADTDLHMPGYDMRSHQASHYGPAHDFAKLELDQFVKQRRFWVAQFAYLIEQLKARPEGDGTMLDHTALVMCTEVCDGNTHSHDNMPFVVAGGPFSGGRLLHTGYRRHGDLLTSVAHKMGQAVGGWGDGSSGPIAEL